MDPRERADLTRILTEYTTWLHHKELEMGQLVGSKIGLPLSSSEDMHALLATTFVSTVLCEEGDVTDE